MIFLENVSKMQYKIIWTHRKRNDYSIYFFLLNAIFYNSNLFEINDKILRTSKFKWIKKLIFLVGRS